MPGLSKSVQAHSCLLSGINDTIRYKADPQEAPNTVAAIPQPILLFTFVYIAHYLPLPTYYHY